MPRNQSFMLTTEQYRNRTKCVTRRLGWWNVKPGELLNGVEKAQGLKKGEKIKRLGQHRIVNTRGEPLKRLIDEPDYGHEECIKEGFPNLSPVEFVTMFCASHRRCTPETKVNRMEFAYVDFDEKSAENAVVESTTITHRGITLAAKKGCIGVEFYGRAASHTGYHSVCNIKYTSTEKMLARARCLIDEYLEAPYLVGRHDLESWRSIEASSVSGGFTIRIPDFHEKLVVQELVSIGFRFTDKINHSLEAPAALSKLDIEKIVAPLLAPGSRAKEETTLVKALRYAYLKSGIPAREKQLALF